MPREPSTRQSKTTRSTATPVETDHVPPTISPAPASLSNLVSQYQTTIGIHSLLDSSSQESVGIVDRPNSTGNPESIADSFSRANNAAKEKRELRSVSTGPQDTIQKHIKSFTPVIDLSDEHVVLAAPKTQASAAKPTKYNRTSISSLINLDENVPLSEAPLKSSAQPEKRKRASPKTDGTSKRTKADPQKKSAKAGAKGEAKTGAKTDPKNDAKDPKNDSKDPKNDPKADISESKVDLTTDPKNEAKPGAKTDVKASKTDAKRTLKETKSDAKNDAKSDPKKAAKLKKKTPELILPSQDKPSIHPTMTTEKSKNAAPAPVVPPPSFISMDESSLGDLGIGGGADEKDKPQVPVIALEIPLLDPKNPRPGQAEVVINVLKLAEEKYGWSAVHPEARSAFELMDDALDDDEEGDDEEDDEVMIVDEKGNSLRKKEDQDKKKKKQQVQQKEQSKINRKVGKYDYEDPFIDDAELQWEEEITTTKEGFFVYWGPLVDERQPSKKGNAKGKK